MAVIAKVTFTQTIDSNHKPQDPHPAPDTGRFTKLSNGDDLETGEMPNPDAGGKVMAYEEIWRELDWRTGRTEVNWILESKTENPKTMYAKVGRFYLVARKTVTDERAVFAALRQDLNIESGQWTTRHEIGDTAELVRLADSGSNNDTVKWKVGDEIAFGFGQYIVRAATSQ